MKKIIIIMFASIFIQGCISVAEHKKAVQDNSLDRITLGKVKREISIGMSGAKVAQVLGSPNIVSTDKNNNEVWIYDKVSTHSASSSSEGGVNILVLFGSENSAASSSFQKTLTIIIKFDKNNKVKDFSYRTSRF